jgi:hypothetical protein
LSNTETTVGSRATTAALGTARAEPHSRKGGAKRHRTREERREGGKKEKRRQENWERGEKGEEEKREGET